MAGLYRYVAYYGKRNVDAHDGADGSGLPKRNISPGQSRTVSPGLAARAENLHVGEHQTADDLEAVQKAMYDSGRAGQSSSNTVNTATDQTSTEQLPLEQEDGETTPIQTRMYRAVQALSGTEPEKD